MRVQISKSIDMLLPTCNSWTASVMHICCSFSNHAHTVPVLPPLHLLAAKFGTSKQGAPSIPNALTLLHLRPAKPQEQAPSHRRLIDDCMHDILGSTRRVTPEAKAPQTSPGTTDISACHSMNKFALPVELHKERISADVSVLASALSSCAVKQSLRGGMQLHALMVKVGYDMSSVHAGTSLISLYARCCRLGSAHQVFQSMPVKNTVSWTALISGYAQDNQVEACLHVFQLMRQSACKPNDITFTTLFGVCTSHAFLALGKAVHGVEMRMGFGPYVHVSNALVSMYAKCGNIDEARSIFEGIACKDLVSWNSMIFGYSQYGLAKHCLNLLKEMEEQCVAPNALSFLGILSSCRHACLVEEGRHCFKTMIRCGVEPKLDHYSCMVDLLGRAGLLDEAWDLIQTMSMPPNGVIWGNLLAACRVHGSVPIGIHAAEHRLKLEPGCAATHIQLANLYASIGCWSDVATGQSEESDEGERAEDEQGVQLDRSRW